MATYAIGDIQGCYDQFQALLEKISFDPTQDRLWLTGDIINRGPGSLQTLRYVMGLGERAITVLGNHECHLLAVAQGHKRPHDSDTFHDILDAPDSEALLHWIRHRPFFHEDPQLGFAMLHAGVPPQWTADDIRARASELETALRDDSFDQFLSEMYGNEPKQWSDDLTGNDRLRCIINCFTRMRFCSPEGRLNLKQKGSPGSQPEKLLPWFEVPGRRSQGLRIIFGHWSQLGLYRSEDVICLDSGCLWGGQLTAMQLETGAQFCEECDRVAQHQSHDPGR